ncbi:MAG: sensor histidine kinase [Romboutsia sp.]|nr:sensor histidine kinase [Romboutsia sp.]
MKIVEYLKDRFKYIILFIIIISIIDIYLFAIDIFKHQYEELLYLNFLILIISFIFFIIDYINLKNKYKDILRCLEIHKDIDTYLISGKSIEDNIMKGIIENLKYQNNEEVKEYRNSLKELDEYIAKWVHEIKIPISALDIITDRLNSIEDSIDIKNQVVKINFLVNSILYSSRSSSMFEDIFFNKVRLDKIVKSSIKNNSFLLIKNNIEVMLNNLDYTVFTDIKCISYILDQIINNAIKYSKEKGKIEFSAKNIENGVVFSIKDYGIGIEKEDIGRVFDKGFTGMNGRNRLYKSTGMGLYFAKNMIDKLGHKIEVSSKKDEYTIFNIYFYDISDYLSHADKV